ncbi:NitT/TauT family transport system substrate-binding protein [Sinosporangium album]|uniref:NitT/TauT family transport system substrate-binding protein n=1 Tax=Sinosporangium album TaxID=504805 RepID=A0A1G7ZNX1_9ACTN|nr:ABC transporter substrate-binding protein [Sinosporangium album]SDH10325.1 NitT/TauT family transport system substrate-binding protein [Sinosporangium album]
MNRVGRTLSVLVALTLVAGCGGGGESADGLREVTIGLVPAAVTAAIHVGIDQKFFEQEGLKPSIETGQGGAALLPAVASGQMEFASSTPVSLLMARDRGLKVRAITPWTGDGTSADGTVKSSNVVLAKDPSIRSARDLEGRTVAINALRSVGDLTIREAVRHAGGNPDKVTFVEMGFADMPGALAQGHVDGIWTAEPFITTLVAKGHHAVKQTDNSDAVPDMATQLIFTSQKLIDDDPDLVAAMTRALGKTLAYVKDNPDKVRARIPTVFAELDPAIVKRLDLDVYETQLRREPLERIGRLLELEKWIKPPADIAGLLP